MIQVICTGLLFAMGWHQFDTDTFFAEGRVVLIFSHTTHWDLILMLLHVGAYQKYFTDLYTVMKPQPFTRWGWILRRMGFIPATSAEDKNGGFIMTTKKALSSESRFRILISPEGRLIATPWRSGYYYLAQELECPVQVVGFDYDLKIFKVFPARPGNSLREDLEPKLKGDMSQIVPLYAHNSFIRVRDVPPHRIGVYDPVFLSLIVGVIPALYYVYQFDVISCIAGGISSLISTVYHHRKEDNPLIQWIDMKGVLVALLIYTIRLWQFNMIVFSWIWLIGMLFTFVCYYKGSGRCCHEPRPPNYNRYHSLYHLGIAWCIMYPVM